MVGQDLFFWVRSLIKDSSLKLMRWLQYPCPMRYSILGVFIIGIFPLVVLFDGPGLLGAFTLVVSFLGALLVGLTRSTWYGMRVWLVYLRGLLVLFLFFCALTPNPSFVLPLKANRLVFFWLFVSSFGLAYSTWDFSMVGLSDFWEVQPFVIYQGRGSFMLIWIGVYLLLTMVLVVKIAPKWGGALREVGTSTLWSKKHESSLKRGEITKISPLVFKKKR